MLQQPIIKLLTGNIRDLYPRHNQNKVPLLQELAIKENISTTEITGTHLHEGILDAEIKMENSDLYRKDKRDRSHDGVAICVEKTLAANSLQTP